MRSWCIHLFRERYTETKKQWINEIICHLPCRAFSVMITHVLQKKHHLCCTVYMSNLKQHIQAPRFAVEPPMKLYPLSSLNDTLSSTKSKRLVEFSFKLFIPLLTFFLTVLENSLSSCLFSGFQVPLPDTAGLHTHQRHQRRSLSPRGGRWRVQVREIIRLFLWALQEIGD